MKKIVAVIGDANIDDDPTKQTLAFETGRLLIESGYILASGGFGGVMEHASRGAKAASNYTQGSIIGFCHSTTHGTLIPTWTSPSHLGWA